MKQTYHWQRFWCPRSSQINFTDDGYLYDPDEKWVRYNPDLVTLEDIANVPCLILLGEPGIGKSKAIETATKTKVDEQEPLFLDLNSYGSEDRLIKNLFESSKFRAWVEGNHLLYIFLDSLDECLLRIDNVTKLLAKKFKQDQDKTDRLFLRIACRPAVWQSSFEEDLKQIWGKDKVKVYELAPLCWLDVRDAAEREGIQEPDLFMQEIQDKKVVPLAIKPITLKFLIDEYLADGQLSKEQTLSDLYLKGCRRLCDEEDDSNPRRPGRKGNLELDQRLMIAARIAAVTVFANRNAISTGRGKIRKEDVLIRELAQGYERVNMRPLKVCEAAITEVWDTGLFSSRGSNRMGWAHQTYAELLAAWYLTQHDISLDQIKTLLFSSKDPDCKLIPQLHETAAWLASMRTDVLEEIVKTDPDVLLRSDVPTDANFRALLVGNLLTQYEQGTLFDSYRNNYRNYSKLKHPGLVEQLRPYICDSTKPIEARHLAVDIAEVCEISELQKELVDIVLDSSQLIYLRVKAAKAICSIGDAATRLKIKPLAIKPLPEDEDDQLKGYILQALWPDYLTAEELFQALTPPKKFHFLGSYQRFLSDIIVPQLTSDDLVIALNWLEKQGVRCFGHSFEELGNAILLKAWDNFDIPGIAESCTKIALIQWRRYKKIITSNSQWQDQFASSLLNENRKRHILLEQAILLISETDENPVILLCLDEFTDKIIVSNDIFWMLEKLKVSENEHIDKILARLIRWKFNEKDAQQIDAILVATQTNDILREIFSPCFTPIELDSALAEQMKAEYIEWQERQARRPNPRLLDPPPKERVIQLLKQLETEDLSAWWQLNLEMTLKPDSRRYGNEFELNLTKLPGWQDAEEGTRDKIIEGAKKYIQQFDDLDYEWIETNIDNQAALADCRALQLLLQESLDFIDQLSSEVWKRWASIIIAIPNYQIEESYLELVKCAYLNAPEELIKTVIKLIDRHSQENEQLSVINRLEKCWDKRLKLAMLEKAQDPTLKAQGFGQILEELVKQELTEAKDFAQSLISLPLPLDKDEQEKVLIAARIVVENSDSDSWLFLWELIQEDSSFGREVFELAAERYSFGFPLNLTETQLADLYIWLVHQYPYNEDPDYSDEPMAHIVTTREGIGRLRDSVLSQLEERGSPQACDEIQRLIQELPNITWLDKTLINAKIKMRRTTWQPPTPEEFLQLVINPEPSNSDLSNQLDTIDRRTKKMEDEPKIDNSINISDSQNSSISHISTSYNSSINQPDSSSESKKGSNWENWLALIGIIVTIIGIIVGIATLYPEEVKQRLNDIRYPQVEQQSTPQNK